MLAINSSALAEVYTALKGVCVMNKVYNVIYGTVTTSQSIHQGLSQWKVNRPFINCSIFEQLMIDILTIFQ